MSVVKRWPIVCPGIRIVDVVIVVVVVDVVLMSHETHSASRLRVLASYTALTLS